MFLFRIIKLDNLLMIDKSGPDNGAAFLFMSTKSLYFPGFYF